jgi:hypothetical protein
LCSRFNFFALRDAGFVLAGWVTGFVHEVRISGPASCHVRELMQMIDDAPLGDLAVALMIVAALLVGYVVRLRAEAKALKRSLARYKGAAKSKIFIAW